MKNLKRFAWFFATIALFAACNSGNSSSKKVSSLKPVTLNKKNFIDTVNGQTTSLYFLKNHEGMQVAITNYGARIVSIVVPNKEGVPTDVVVGFPNVKEYMKVKDCFYGATIGRVANRIAKGEFTLDGKTYHLAINNPPNSLHGGEPGYQEIVWDANQIDDSTIQLSYLSKDGQSGYPGNLAIKVTYSLEANDSLKISYEAKTDKETLCALTNHAYFNLNGVGSGNIYDQLVQINADQITPVDSTLIPTGKFDSVKGTPFDFLKLTAIGKRIKEKNTQLHYCGGYDMNFVLNNPKPGRMFHAATAIGNKSGIVMNVYTDEPGLQFYSGNFMAGKHFIEKGVKDDYRTAFTMETQHFPDTPHHKNFPPIVLNPGQTYSSCSIYQFSVTKK